VKVAAVAAEPVTPLLLLALLLLLLLSIPCLDYAHHYCQWQCWCLLLLL
jgi:hypothetical protein